MWSSAHYLWWADLLLKTAKHQRSIGRSNRVELFGAMLSLKRYRMAKRLELAGAL